MSEPFVLDITPNFNMDSLKTFKSAVNELRSQIDGMKDSFSSTFDGLDQPAQLLGAHLDKCMAIADNLTKKTDEASRKLSNGNISDAERNAIYQQLRNGKDDLMTVKSMLDGNDFYGNFSVSLAKSMFSGLPAAIKAEINAITPQLSGALRRFYNTLNTSMQSGGLDSQLVRKIATRASKDPVVSEILNGTNLTAKQKDSLLKTIIPLTRPIQYSAEYQSARFGSKGPQVPKRITDVESLMPELYKGSYAGGGYKFSKTPLGRTRSTKVLNPAAMDILQDRVTNNPIVARAAERAGVISRNSDGNPVLRGNISYRQLGKLSEALYNEYQTRTRGLYNKVQDYYGGKPEIQNKIIDRSLNGTGGTALLGMKTISDLMLNGNNFTKRSTETGAWRPIVGQSKPLKEQYLVSKINPFRNVAPSQVAIAESQVTRMLGLQGHNYENTGAIKIVSLDGYNEKNPQHQKIFADLQQNGLKDKNGDEYVFHTIHGTGQDAAIRMIRRKEYDAVRAKYAPLADSLGLKGNDVWNTFIPRNHVFGDATAFGKHQDQLNKMWTDAIEAQGDLSDKKFAFVDFSSIDAATKKQMKHSDGLGFVGRGIIPHDAQVRLGLSGKGSLVSLDQFDTIGDWAKSAGLTDEKGRFMVPGFNGELFDASGYHGLIDKTVVKNLLAYDGKTNEQANAALTGMIRAFPIGMVADYSYDADAKGLGPQMMSFMRLSPQLMQHQSEAFVKRLNALETLEGMRRYVFDRPDQDYLSALANDPEHGDEYLLSDPRFAKRVDIYRNSLFRSVASGEFLDLDNIADIKNERLLRNPILAYALTNGGLTDETLSNYGEILSKAHGRPFSNDEVRKLVMLEGGLVDFEHINSDMVAAARSPTGFGQVIARKNYAKILEPLYTKLGGLTTEGIQLNDKDLETLAGADMDADEAKVIATIKNKYGIDLVKEIGDYAAHIQNVTKDFPDFNVKFNALGPVSGSNTVDNVENWKRIAALSVDAPSKMGYWSGVGSRLSMLDSFSDSAKMIARISMKGNMGYDQATTSVKKPGQSDADAETRAALGLGYEYQKLPASLEALYNVKANIDPKTGETFFTTFDEKTHIDPKNVFRTSGGRYVNLDYFRGVDGTKLDRTNLPSVFSSSAMMGLLTGSLMTKNGYNDGTMTQDLLEAMGVVDVPAGEYSTPFSFGEAGPAVKRLMKNKRGLLAQFAGLSRYSVTEEESSILASQYAEAMQEINQDADKLLSASDRRGQIKLSDGSYQYRKDYIKDRIKAAGLDTVSLMLGQFDKLGGDLVNIGPTTGNITAAFGNADQFRNPAGITLFDTTPGRFGSAYSPFAKVYTNGVAEPIYVDSAGNPVATMPPPSSSPSSPSVPPSNPPNNPPPGGPPSEPPKGPPAEFDYDKLIQGIAKEDAQMANRMLEGENSRLAASDIREDMDNLQRSLNKEIFANNEEATPADNWYKQTKGYLRKIHNTFDYATTHGDPSVFANDSLIGSQLYAKDADLEASYIAAREKRFGRVTDKNLQNLIDTAEGRSGASARQVARIEQMNQLIANQESELAQYTNDNAVTPGTDQKAFEQNIAKVKEQIEQMKEKKNEAIQQIMEENTQQFTDMSAEFESEINGTNKTEDYKISKKVEQTKRGLIQFASTLDEFFEKNLISEDTYNKLKDQQESQLMQVYDGSYRKRLEQKSALRKELQDLTSGYSMGMMDLQGQQTVAGMRRSFNMERQQQNMRYATSNLAYSYLAYQQRKSAAQNRVDAINDKIARGEKTQAYYKERLDKTKEIGTEEQIAEAQAKYDQATGQLKNFRSEAAEANNELKQLSGAGAAAEQVFANFGKSLSRVVTMIGRRIFQQALQETKRFIKEFDSSMNEIQAITLKSNDEMQGIRSQTIAKAIGLRTSVSNVATTEAALYRQGLSDQEVSSRTDSIIKFATVTKLNVAEATKIITTALQNDLVKSATEAMDALVALGDSAATTAAEIGKGMQKAAASAKVAGVSYSELTALLTIGTSDTQLSGTQVGTALQTVFTRMRRLTTSGYTADQNGEKTTANDAEAALKTVGIDLWEDKAAGKMRTAYQIMSDLSKVWLTLSDAQKSIVTSAMAGTRQTNVFSTLMEGMAEDGGATLDKYLGLGENSQGITQSKYEIAMQSLSASMDTLKSSWDAVVESFVTGGSVTGILDGLSDFLQNFADTGNIEKGFSVIVGGITAIGIAIAALRAGSPVLTAFSGVLALIGGLAAFATSAAFTGAINKALNPESEQERMLRLSAEDKEVNETLRNYRDSKLTNAQKALEEVKKLGKEYDELQSAESEDALTKSLGSLADAFPEVSSAIQEAIEDLSKWKDAVEQADEAGQKYLANNTKTSVDSAIQHLRTYAQAEYEDYLTSVVSPQDKIEGKKEFIKFLQDYKEGTGHEADSPFAKYVTNGELDVEKLLSAPQTTKANILTLAYQRNEAFKKAANAYLSQVSPDTINKLGHADIRDKEIQALYSAVLPDILENLDSIPLGDSIYNSLKNQGVTDPRILSILGNGRINKEAYDALEYDETKATAFYKAFTDSPELQRYVKQYDAKQAELIGDNYVPIYDMLSSQEAFQNSWYNNKERLASVFGNILDVSQNSSYNAELRRVSVEFAKGMAKELPLDLMATDEFGEEFITETLLAGLAEEINNNPELYYDQGKLVTNKVTDYLDQFMASWITNPKFLNDYIEQYAPDSAYSYFIGKGENRLKFTSLDKAMEYVRANKDLAFTDIEGQHGEKAYTTAEQAFSAMREAAVSESTKTYNRALELIKESNSFEELRSKYDQEGLGQEFANAIMGNDELLAAYVALKDQNLGFEDFKTIAEQTKPGRSNAADAAKRILGYLTSGKIKTTEFRQDEAFKGMYESFKSFFGDNADQIVNAIEDRVYDSSKDLQNYAAAIIASKAIKQGTGLRQFTGVETAKLAKQALGYQSLTAAQEGLTKWTTDEWSALTSKYPDLERYLLMTEEQRSSQEGQNLKRNIDIELSVAGVSDLEEANKVLEGTTSLIQNLQKGGDIAIKARLDFESQIYNVGQQEALLNGGSAQEQLETIMSLTGYSKAKVQKDLSGARTLAESLLGQQKNKISASLDTLYQTNPELAALLAASYGFEQTGKGMTSDEAIAEVLEYYRGLYSNLYIDEETGELYTNVNGYKAKAGSGAQERYLENISPGYIAKKTPEIDRENLLDNIVQYSKSDLAKAQMSILNGELSAEKGDYDLYKAAASGLGYYSLEYLRKGKNATANDRALADAEIAATLKEAEESEKLEASKLSATSIGGALSYANLRYQQNNKGALAANTIYEKLAGKNIQSVADLSKAVNKTDVENWKDLLESSEDVRKAFDDMGAKVSEDGKSIDFSNVEDSADGLASAFAMLMQAVAGASDEYSKQREVLSTGETYALATKFLAGTVTDEEKGYSALAEITGNSDLAQIVRNNYSNFSKGIGERLEQGDYFKDGSWYDDHGKLLRTFNPYEGLTDYNTNYAKMLFENAGYGISGLTDIQRYDELQKLIAAANTGNATNGIGYLRQQDKIGAFADYTAGIEGADKWLSASEQLEKYGLTMAQLQNLDKNSEQYKIAEEAISGIYASVEQAVEANEEFEDSVTQAGRKLKTNGKYIDEYNIGLKKNSKNTKEAAAATVNYNKTMSDVMSRQYARHQFKENGTVSDELASMLGVSKKEIEANKEKYLEQLSLFEDTDKDLVASMIQGQFDDIMQQVQAEGIDIGDFVVETNGQVSLDMSKLQGQISGEAAQALAALASELAGQGVTWHAVPFGNGENGGVMIVVDNLGGGRKGGGGGGGGGKSAIDKMLEEHKHKIGQIEHESKMLEIEEKGYEFTNDYDAQRENIQQQVGVQEELRSAYTDNISEMRTQLANVKEGTDDWWKLTEAIQAAEEALASINNTIHDLNSKNLDILSRQQENEDKPLSHRASMLQKYAERAQTQDNFETYKSAMEQVIQETRNQISLNNEQIKAWEKELLNWDETDQAWIDTRNKIWEIREENADLENQVLSSERDLKEAQIAQIANDLQNDTMFFTHSNAMLDTFGQMYQQTGNFDEYRNAISSSMDNLADIREARQKAIKQIKAEIEQMSEDNPARQQAIQTLYDLEEQDAQDQANLLAQRKALEESYLTQIEQEFGDRENVNTHEKNLLQEAEKSALRDENFAQYRNILEEEARNTGDRIQLVQDKLASLLELESNGSITEGSNEWRQLQEAIRTAEEEIASATNEQQEFNDKIKEAKFEELQDNFNDVHELEQHQLKLIQYKQTQYQNNGELTNYGTALTWEQDALEEQKETIEDYIVELKKQQEEAEDQPKLYERITNELYKQEEALAQVNNAIDKNTQAQEKNAEAIRKAQIAVEQQADKVIRERIQKEKDMLNATVSIENSILSVIKKNYQDQWDLEKKTLEKKKQALQEEKNLINDRLNARKNAVDQENKYEELAEYQHQLALISADTTRTKEQAELRRKIADLQEELAMDVATQEANAQIKSIDDQIKAQDDYVTAYQEDLTEMLSNSNNFREELDNLLSGSFEDFMDWNAKYNEDYNKKTDEERKQMEESWHTTWRTMKDELLTYWDEVDESMRSKESWLDLVTSQDSYLKLSDTEKESYLYQMGKLYDDYQKSLIDNAEFDDSHQILNKISEMKTWTFRVTEVGKEDYQFDSSISDFDYNRKKAAEELKEDQDYHGVHKAPDPEPAAPVNSSGSGGGSGSKNTYYIYGTKGEYRGTVQAANEESAYKIAREKYGDPGLSVYTKKIPDRGAGSPFVEQETVSNVVSAASSGIKTSVLGINNALSEKLKEMFESTSGFSEGGLVDYTGLAKVHGTKIKPESFLDADDTALLRGMLDTFSHVKTPYITRIDDSNFGNSGVNIGDVNVNLYEAKLENDADYDLIAQKVGKAFTKQLQKDGLNLVNYAW